MKLSKSPSALIRPKCLAEECLSADGKWDPEKWFRSFDGSRGSSPLTYPGSRESRKRPSESERDVLVRRRPSGKTLLLCIASSFRTIGWYIL